MTAEQKEKRRATAFAQLGENHEIWGVLIGLIEDEIEFSVEQGSLCQLPDSERAWQCGYTRGLLNLKAALLTYRRRGAEETRTEPD